MRLWPVLLIGSIAITTAWGQAPRWRAMHAQSPTAISGLVQVDDHGNQSWWTSTSGPQLKMNGVFITPPRAGQLSALAGDGTIWGGAEGTAATWNPSTNVITDYNTGGFAGPYLYNPSGGFLGSKYWGGPSSVIHYYFLSQQQGPRQVLGADGESSINHLNGSGIISGAMGPQVGFSFVNPGIWTDEGQVFHARTAPGMARGSVLFTDDNGISFGLMESATGTRRSVWWNPDGTVLRTEAWGNFRTDMFASSSSDGRFVIGTGLPGQHQFQRTPKYWSPNTGLVDLEPLVEGLPSGYRIFEASGLTDQGRMTVQLVKRTDYNDRIYNYYLEPVPEPATLAGLALGLGWLVRRRRCGV